MLKEISSEISQSDFSSLIQIIPYHLISLALTDITFQIGLSFNKHQIKMAKVRGAVVVDNDVCKGCNLCVVACPTQVLALNRNVNNKGYHYSYMENPDNCNGCTNCSAVCPDSCITVYRVKAEA